MSEEDCVRCGAVGVGASEHRTMGLVPCEPPALRSAEQPDLEAISARRLARVADYDPYEGHLLQSRCTEAENDIDALLTEIERYKAMVASEHELLNGIIQEGETPLDAIRRVVEENARLQLPLRCAYCSAPDEAHVADEDGLWKIWIADPTYPLWGTPHRKVMRRLGGDEAEMR